MVAQQPSADELPTEEFSEEDFSKAWKAYTKKIEKDGRFNLLSHLTMGSPALDGNLIHLVFPNTTIKVEVERAQGELLEFLRKKLKNYEISLSVEVNEAETKRYAYTPREKFDKMNEKNPLLSTIRKEFDLDL